MRTIMEKARDIVDQVGELPAIPSVVMKSMSLLNDPSVTVKRIQEQILLDQSLTAFILKVANSALYGLRKEVSTVSYAINLMGYNTTKSILMAYLTKNMYKSKGSKFIQNILWKHSLATAVFGKKFAETVSKVNVEETFIAGLLHDIGKGVLFRNKTVDFEEMVQAIVNENGGSIKIESNKWGFSHVEVGYLLMKNWRFSDNIIETLVYHHNIQDYYGDNLMVPIISIANKMSHMHGYSFKKNEEDLFELEILKTPANKLDDIVNEAQEEINNYLEIMI